jgi:hypothetical protein
LSALENSLPTDCGTPAFFANSELCATARMKSACFLLVLGTAAPQVVNLALQPVKPFQ